MYLPMLCLAFRLVVRQPNEGPYASRGKGMLGYARSSIEYRTYLFAYDYYIYLFISEYMYLFMF